MFLSAHRPNKRISLCSIGIQHKWKRNLETKTHSDYLWALILVKRSCIVQSIKICISKNCLEKPLYRPTKRSFQRCMHNLIVISVQSCRNTRASSSVIFFSTTNLLLFENHKSLFPIRITLSIQETHQEMR